MSIYSNLCDHLLTLTLSPELPIAWPDTHFTPPNDGKFLEVIYLTNPTQTISMDNSGVQHETGIFQVNVFWPVGYGKVAPLAVAEQIKAHFAKGTNVGSSPRIDSSPWIGSSIANRDEFSPYKGQYSITPVTIPWAN